MSYGLECNCNVCESRDKCNDRHFIEGAIQGIHFVWPSSKGHLGSGIIRLDCNNFKKIEEMK